MLCERKPFQVIARDIIDERRGFELEGLHHISFEIYPVSERLLDVETVEAWQKLE